MYFSRVGRLQEKSKVHSIRIVLNHKEFKRKETYDN